MKCALVDSVVVTPCRVFGDSHTDALRRAVTKDQRTDIVVTNAHSARDPADLIRAFKPAMCLPASLYVSMIGGNGHNVLGLMRTGEPFDFVHPEAPDLPLEQDFDALAFDDVENRLRELIEPEMKALAAIRAAFDGPMIHLESPPPVEDDEFASEKLERFFQDRGERVVFSHMRWRLWRLHSGIFRKQCEAVGIDFIPAPASAMTNGYLARDCYGKGPTHANEAYGRRLIDQITETNSAVIEAVEEMGRLGLGLPPCEKSVT